VQHGPYEMATFEAMPERNTPKWKLAHWRDLSKEEWDAACKARIDVFVVEQTCAYPELDGKDRQSWHLLAMGLNESVDAYLRILPPNLSYKEWSIGRVLTSASARGVGLGRELMSRAISWMQKTHPHEDIRISAQVEQVEWYGQWNFVTVGASYLEDDIPHIEMLRKSKP